MSGSIEWAWDRISVIIAETARKQGEWISAVDVSLWHQFFTSDLKEWIAINILSTMDKNLHGEWSSFWAMACHLAWNWRNKEKQEENFIRPINQTQFVRQSIDSYMMADGVIQKGNQLQQTIIQVGWKPPT
ncbi:hypothetical protein L195_g033022 [Trifolium pratense]|uniref:Uncharacterized protein n=1 Tax=Trifolium pratense TaxID=57577 RepID=A0A2K3LEV7_TRIPR|nr:hypothetical protein L195_g033022 [Trifolium pratense]